MRFRFFGDGTPTLERQMEKNMEHEMSTGLTGGGLMGTGCREA